MQSFIVFLINKQIFFEIFCFFEIPQSLEDKDVARDYDWGLKMEKHLVALFWWRNNSDGTEMTSSLIY